MLFDLERLPLQFGLLGCAFLLCSLIGLERHFRHKPAGIRTHALVGLGSALFTLISMEGFVNIVDYPVIRDPSRIAAQIVSGVGFLGAGLIFVNRDVVRGLTTAASIWLTAAVGMASGAGLLPLAVFATGLHFATVFVLAPLGRLIPQSGGRSKVLVTYEDGRGILRELLSEATALGCQTTLAWTRQKRVDGNALIQAEMKFRLGPPLRDVMSQLADLPGVVRVELCDQHDDSDTS